MWCIDYFIAHKRYLNIVGILVVVAIAYIFSSHKKKINLSLVRNAFLLQLLLAFFALKTAAGKVAIAYLSAGVRYLYTYASVGTEFLFGGLAQGTGTAWGTIFAVQVLPMIIFFGAFMSILFYFGVVQKIVAVLGYGMRPLLGTTGPETLCAVANSFLGQTEAPLLIKNYLQSMTKSEIFVVMVSGMGTISGSILVAYAKFGAPVEHLLASSVMAIPAAILVAKILVPETEKVNSADVALADEQKASNLFDAISTGTSDGMYLALNVGAMLIAFISLMAMINGSLSGVIAYINYLFGLKLPLITLNTLFSYIFYPFAYLLGFSGKEAISIGELLGTKVAINEFVAYLKLVHMGLSERAIALTTYALCGFSNFSCIGIQVGGIGILVPSKRQWLTELGLKAVLGGTLTNLLTAMVAGLFI